MNILDNLELKHYSYMSIGKIDNLFTQISEFSPSKVSYSKSSRASADLDVSSPSLFGMLKARIGFGTSREKGTIYEGELDTAHKLKMILENYRRNDQISDLNRCIDQHDVPKCTACYSYTGDFSALGEDRLREFCDTNTSYMESVKVDTSFNPPYCGVEARSGLAVIESNCYDYKLVLACSFKYFSDMGSSRVFASGEDGGRDYFQIHPHSGNASFFRGKHSARYEALFLLTGQQDNTLYGSPIVLMNCFSPKL